MQYTYGVQSSWSLSIMNCSPHREAHHPCPTQEQYLEYGTNLNRFGGVGMPSKNNWSGIKWWKIKNSSLPPKSSYALYVILQIKDSLPF